jgi:flagellar basal body-associated protein FliL
MIKIILALAVIGGVAYMLFVFSKKKTPPVEAEASGTGVGAVPDFTPVVESAIEMDNPLLRRLKNLRM